MKTKPAHTGQEHTMSAELYKKQGNDAFAANDFQAAIKAYTKGIELDPNNAVFYSNRSAAYLEAKDYELALKDGLTTVMAMSGWSRGFFRVGRAQECMGRLKEALSSYDTGLSLDPSNEALQTRAKEVRSQLKQDKADGNRVVEWDLSAINPGEHTVATLMKQAGMGEGKFTPSGWADGLNGTEQREWLVDVYRMRVMDDDYHGGGNLHGARAQHVKGLEKWIHILEDFLIFCKLAVARQVVPPKWDWRLFLLVALGNITTKIEKQDLQVKWRTENAFEGLLGGRSARFTGEVVYGYPCDRPGGEHIEIGKLKSAVYTKWQSLKRVANTPYGVAVFQDIGGVEEWLQFERNLNELYSMS